MSKIMDEYDTQQEGKLSHDEFLEICSRSMPEVSTIEASKRYKLAEQFYGKDQVKLDRLAAIGAYLLLFTSYMKGWNKSIISEKYRV
jgi:hypothetical protein